MNFHTSYNLKNNTGFTLIETLVAITILLIAIAGPLTLATRSFLNAFVARDQLTASYLAEDAIEYIRYRRDTNFLKRDDWLAGLDSCKVGSCKIDTVVGEITSCSGGTCQLLKYDDFSGLYGYASGAESIFERTLTIRPVGVSTDEYVVEATIKWHTRSLERSFTTKEHIFNWLGT